MIHLANMYYDFLDIQDKNKEKIQECIDKYIGARKLPRKLKKKVKKQAERDYNFWKAIDKWHSDLFKID